MEATLLKRNFVHQVNNFWMWEHRRTLIRTISKKCTEIWKLDRRNSKSFRVKSQNDQETMFVFGWLAKICMQQKWRRHTESTTKHNICSNALTRLLRVKPASPPYVISIDSKDSSICSSTRPFFCCFHFLSFTETGIYCCRLKQRSHNICIIHKYCVRALEWEQLQCNVHTRNLDPHIYIRNKCRL